MNKDCYYDITHPTIIRPVEYFLGRTKFHRKYNSMHRHV